MIDTLNLQEARKQIELQAKRGKEVVVQGKSIDFNRIILENKKVNTLVLCHTNKKDRLKQRDSGLNHVLCNIAKKNNITLAIDMNELTNKEKKEKALILSRIIQNIRLMKKAGNKFKLLNFKNKQQAFSLLLTLGANTEIAKEALS